MAKIAIDCDGVLANFNEGFIEVANKMYPGSFPRGYVPRAWDFPVVDGKLTRTQMENVWKKIKATENWWLGLSAYNDSMMALANWLIMNQNQEVYIVTSRAPTVGLTVSHQTDWWLRACGIAPVNNYLGVLVVPDHNEKWRVYQYGGFDYSIDDKLETVQQCDAIHPELYNHKSYLLDRPWNQQGTVARRVRTLDAFLKECK